MAVLEKVDFAKDLQVAALPHKNHTNAFSMWMSIFVPLLTILFYYIVIKRYLEFVSNFFGFAEVWSLSPSNNKEAASVIGLVERQKRIMDKYDFLKTQDIEQGQK